MACATVVMRGLYALGLAKGAFINTLISIASTLICSLILLKPFGLAGLAAAPSIAFTIASVTGIITISKELSKMQKEQNKTGEGSHFSISLNWMIKISFCLIALAIYLLLLKGMIPYDTNSAFMTRALTIFFILASGALLYALITYFFKFNEWRWLRGAIKINKK